MSLRPHARRSALASCALCLLLQLPTHAQPTPIASSPGPASTEQAKPPSAPEPETAAIGSTASGELRGMWVVRESLASPQSVHQVVVTATKYHINALFVQVRGRGDAWYNSPYEPRAERLAGQPKEFDPLAQLITEGHAAGLQVHAWLNTFLTWSGSRRPRSPQHLWNAHPDWFALDRHGRCSPVETNSCEGVFLSPSNPAVQQHLVNVFTDVAARYDLDGIHFDYCRYASKDYDFGAGAVQRFRDYMASQISTPEVAHLDGNIKSDRLAYVHAFGSQWAEWRRAQITGIVAKISQTVKAAKPYMQVTAAVFPDADEAFAVRGQDWRGWLKAGYLDAVALMAYDRNTDRVLRQTRAAIAAAGDKQVITGVGAWRLDAGDVAHKIIEIRKTGAAGVNLFSYDGMHTRANYLDTLARGVFASRAAPRKMRWLPDRATSDRTAPREATGSAGDRKTGSGTQGAGDRR